MPPYHEAFKKDEQVRIVSLDLLNEFKRTWRWHHPLADDQLLRAKKLAKVKRIGYYHGGDVLYELRGITGIWHEECLEDPTLDELLPAFQVFQVSRELRDGSYVVVQDRTGAERFAAKESIWTGDLRGMSEVLQRRSVLGFAHRYGFNHKLHSTSRRSG